MTRNARKASKRKKPVPTLAKLKKRAWALLSECVRREAARVKGYVLGQNDFAYCYTCQEPHVWRELQAGHAIGGRNGAVLFDEEIIRPQCVRCNIMLRGNYPVFISKLLQEHGLGPEAFEWWDAKLAGAKQIKKWTRDELQGKIDSYKVRLEKLG